MAQSEPDFFGLILWILSLVILGVFVGASLLVYRWQQSVSQILAPLIQRLIRLENGLHQSLARLGDYSSADPAPFGRRMAKLTVQSHQLEEHNHHLRQIYANLQAERRRFGLHSWQIVVGAPFYWYPWYRLFQAALRLDHQLEVLEGELSEFDTGVAGLLDTGWQVAVRAREYFHKYAELAGRREQLAGEHFTGEAFQAASERIAAAQAALAGLPLLLREGDQAQVRVEISKEQIVAAYQQLAHLATEYEQLDTDLERWDGQYRQACQAASRLRAELTKLQSAMISTPEAVDFAILKSRADQLEHHADEMEVRLSHPDVDELVSIEEQSRQLADETQSLLASYTHTRKTQSGFEARLEDVQAQQEALSRMLVELMKASEFPVKWRTRTQRLAKIGAHIDQLLTSHLPRTPEEVTRDSNQLDELYKQQFQLRRECRALADQHHAAVHLYQELNLPELLQWSERVISLAQQAVALGIQNFPHDLKLGSFEQDVRDFQQLIHNQLPEDIRQPVKEADIPALRANLQHTVSTAEALYARANSTEAYIRDIKARFQQAHQQWQTLHTLRQQMDWLANSNPVLETSAGKDLNALERKLEQSKGALSASDQGTVDSKLATLNDLEEDMVIKAQNWLAALTKDIGVRRNLITTRLDELSGIAQLDDPVLERIRKLLSRAGMPGSHSETLELEAIVPQIKKTADLWQEWTAVGQELDELIYKPLIDAYQDAEGERQVARQALSLADQVAPSDLRWPPTTVTFAEDRQIYAELDGRWQGLNTEPSRAIWAVRRYSDLAADFRVWRRQVQQKTAFAHQEQERITMLEESIASLAKTLRQRYRAVESPAGMSARNEAARALAKLEDVRTAWRQKSAPSLEPTYDQVYEELFTIKDRLRLAGAEGESPG